MTKKLFIDAAHPEEVRVVILDHNKLEEYDYETTAKKQLKGNIYLGKITRVEPSLQAAFVDYGGGRQGFLAFSEIHPDYYRIPVDDRGSPFAEEHPLENSSQFLEADALKRDTESAQGPEQDVTQDVTQNPGQSPEQLAELSYASDSSDPADQTEPKAEQQEQIESNKEDEEEEARKAYERRIPLYKKYRIQEVIKKRQIVLVQVTREERGSKGAALTTYISLPGRYCVLMPNTDKDSGGISRKINDPSDRKKLKEVISDLQVEEGMSVIVRTAGSGRSKTEIKRDFEALMRLWDNIRTQTMSSTAPALIFEEGDLIRRALRDLYTREVEEIFIEGEEGYKNARTFMKLLVPSHVKKIQLYKEAAIPLFHKHHIEEQIASIDTPIAQLPSGGYLIINQTEALVSIDVNSGRSTRERNIEETALKTNLEAADEVARQLRLRDLGGLIVIDFIDMDDHNNQHSVEKRLKEAVKFDRARIQIGRISQFGLLEMSRQRLRPSVLEMNSQTCGHCGGHGTIRSVEARALKILRALESEAIDHPQYEMQIILPAPVALYILNEKRSILMHIEAQYGLKVQFVTEDLMPYEYSINRIKNLAAPQITAIKAQAPETEDLEQTHTPPHPGHPNPEQTQKHPRRHRRDRRFQKEDADAQSTQLGEQAEAQLINPSKLNRNHRKRPGGPEFFDLSADNNDTTHQASELLLTDEVVFETSESSPQTEQKQRPHRDRNYLRRGARMRGLRKKEQDASVINENTFPNIQNETASPEHATSFEATATPKADMVEAQPEQIPFEQASENKESQPKRDSYRDRQDRKSRDGRNGRGARDNGRDGGRDNRERRERTPRPPKAPGKVEIISSPIYQPDTSDISGISKGNESKKVPAQIVQDAPEKPKAGWWKKG